MIRCKITDEWREYIYLVIISIELQLSSFIFSRQWSYSCRSV